MPELPEAETIARALNRTLKKRKITKVEVFAKKLRSSLQPLSFDATRATSVKRVMRSDSVARCPVPPSPLIRSPSQ